MIMNKDTVSEKRSAEKKKNLDNALLQLEKHYGKDAVIKIDDQRQREVEVFSTGILSLDYALGIGGIPRGRVIEIYGPESSGKTTVALEIVASCQRNGGLCSYIDAEHAIDVIYAENLGVDIENLYISQPNNGEEALEICETLVSSGAMDLVVIDSVAALTPRVELDGEMGDSFIGLQARLMSQAMRKLIAITSKTKTSIIFINQMREKIGVMFASPETTTGGKALKFYSSIRMDVRRSEAIKDGNDVVGNRVKVKIVKNKLYAPNKVAEFDIIFGKGVSKSGILLDYGIEFGIIDKSGSWFSYKDNKIGQGKENAKALIEKDTELSNEIEKLVREKMAEKLSTYFKSIKNIKIDNNTTNGVNSEDGKE